MRWARSSNTSNSIKGRRSNMVSRSRSLFDGEILGPAIVASFQKLDPRVQLSNPVMFICEVGALVTLIYAIHDAMAGNGQLGFDIAISIWLWFTVVFANFAEAVAEGRGKAQAEFLRRTKTETSANRIVDGKLQDRQRDAAAQRRSRPRRGRRTDSRPTATSSKARQRSTNRRSPASRRPSFAKPAAIAAAVTGGTRVLSDSDRFRRRVPTPANRSSTG